MTEDIRRVAIVGNPNCGKSALFNAMTGLRQKVANYPGATVERRTGFIKAQSTVELTDLPGTYSLSPKSPDEQVTAEVLKGEHATDPKPDMMLVVLNATNIAHQLSFLLELRTLGIPMHVALNMTDLAAREHIDLDAAKLSELLGIGVTETVAVRRTGLDTLNDILTGDLPQPPSPDLPFLTTPTVSGETVSIRERQTQARAIANQVILSEGVGHRATRLLDSVLLHSLAGPTILFAILFVMFQAVFSWSEGPMEAIDAGIAALQTTADGRLGGGMFESFVQDGILGGVGAVVVFFPQILILFAFILTLESTGYMARAAFLMDNLMAKVGLNGRAFIPLLSSFACAIPGIMSARTIADPSDRLTTILISPLMTCSARLPVYTLIIAAFIPNISVWGGLNLQGLVMFALYLTGIMSALIVAFILKRTVAKAPPVPFLMELPKYQWPNWRFVAIGLVERARIFLRRAGTIILYSTVILWGLAIWPSPPEGADGPDIGYSLVGILGRWLEVIFAPIGFSWEISVALIPGMAAREVSIAALGTIYSLSGSDDAVAAGLVDVLQGAWSLPTALSFLAWYIFAPMCLSTMAVTRRETGGWTWALFQVGYLFALAYATSFIVFQLASRLLHS